MKDTNLKEVKGEIAKAIYFINKMQLLTLLIIDS